MSFYFSASLMGFIPEHWKHDGTFDSKSWPADAVIMTDEECEVYRNSDQPEGMQLGASDRGRPIWVKNVEVDLGFTQSMLILNNKYRSDRLELCSAWLVAAVADGVNEVARKADVEAELSALDAKNSEDVQALKDKYGVK